MRVFRDTWLLLGRSVRSTLRNPTWVVIGLFQPVCYLLLFAPLLQPLSQVPGFPPGGALTVFTPGLMVLMALFGSISTSYGLLFELQTGVIERFRVTPVSRWALLLGLVLRDVLVVLVQMVLMSPVALLMGARINVVGFSLALALLAMLGVCLSSCACALALALKDSNSFAALVQTLITPVMFLSGILLPLTLAPPVLRTIGKFNPFAYAVDAARHLFMGNLADVSVAQGFGLMAGLMVLALLWGVRSFKRATA
jgi:ABC-2 type transport system permease protein